MQSRSLVFSSIPPPPASNVPHTRVKMKAGQKQDAHGQVISDNYRADSLHQPGDLSRSGIICDAAAWSSQGSQTPSA